LTPVIPDKHETQSAEEVIALPVPRLVEMAATAEVIEQLVQLSCLNQFHSHELGKQHRNMMPNSISKDLLHSRIMPRSSSDSAGGSFRSIEYLSAGSFCVAKGAMLAVFAALPWLVKLISYSLNTHVGTAIAEACSYCSIAIE
jgi:hypothetical protein